MIKTIYIGANFCTAEYIVHNEKFMLEAIICEKNKISDELLTFSLVRNIDLFAIDNKAELVAVMNRIGNQYIYIMHMFGVRIPMEKLNGFSVYNIHPSKLPGYKGAHPTYWQTVNNEINIGISIHVVTKEIDEGTIIGQETVPYYIWEDDLTLTKNLEYKIPGLLEKLFSYLDGQDVVTVLNRAGDYYPKVTENEVFIDLKKDSPNLIYNKVRTQTRYGGAKIRLSGKVFCLEKILFKEAQLEDECVETKGHLYIRYTDKLVIDASSYRQCHV